MRDLAQFMQRDFRYVAISLGIGGIQPHPAAEVFAHRYGDCKDKATLMRSMLKEIGVDSYYVIINHNRGAVTLETPAHLGAFDHVIVAIKLPDGLSDPSLVATTKHPSLGMLLFFDPTHPCVFLGDLPFYLQGSKVHVIFPGNDRLTELPLLPPDRYHNLQRSAKILMMADGSIRGELELRGLGSVGAAERERYKNMTPTDFNKGIETSLNACIAGAKLTSFNMEDISNTGEFVEKMQFSAPRFAQMLPDNLMVVRLDVFPQGNLPNLPSVERRQPLALSPLDLRDRLSVEIPAGFAVDELPSAVELRSAYGSYERKCTMIDGCLVVTRSLTLVDRRVPVVE